MDFNSLYNQYKKQLTWYANSKVGDLMVSEEIVDDAFIVLWSNKDRRHSNVLAYLYNIVNHRCIKHNKSFYNKKIVSTDSFDPYIIDDTNDYLGDNEQKYYSLLCQFDRLTYKQARCLYAFYIKGMSNKEIATINKKNVKTISTIKLFGINRLRRLLKLRSNPIKNGKTKLKL